MGAQSPFYNCAECNIAINFVEEASTQCSNCNKDFCFALTSTCFSQYHRKSQCKGTALSISNPKWIINLRVINKE